MPVNWCIRQDSHLQTLRSKRRMIIISPRMRNGADGETCTLVGQCPAVYKTAAVAAEPHRQIGGSPRIRTEFSPVKSRDFTVKVCNPYRDAKAELNHRSQACEVLTGTGVRVAKIGRASGYRALYSGLEDRRVSLNTYARWNPVLESHQPLRFCKPPPELLGQWDGN